MVSIIIPSRNEIYLQKTILDILSKVKGEVEIIAVLDGWWESADKIVDDPRVNYLHFPEPRGMRGAINAGVAIARGEYILKTDAHCMFGKGFDEILVADMKDNWVVVPRRYALDPVSWLILENPKYPIDYMYLSKDLHGEVWTEKNKESVRGNLKDVLIDDLMSAQGSCWFMKKDYYKELELLDEETYGIFFNEFQEIGLKCWLSGGEVKVNKKTWYAHFHKTDGRGYSLSKEEQPKALEAVGRWITGQGWHKQIHSVSWLINKFRPVPGWSIDLPHPENDDEVGEPIMEFKN